MTDGATRRRVLAGACGVALPAIAGCGWIERDERTTFDQSIDVGSAGSLAVESDTGDVSLGRHDGDGVRVHGEKRAASEDALDAVSVVTERDGDRVALRTERDGGSGALGLRRPPTLHLDVSVPAELPVERVTSAAGSLDVQHVTGPIAAAAGAGDVYVANVDGDVTVSADDGGVTVRDVTGTISARTATGNVTVDGDISTLETDTGQIGATVRGLAPDASIRTDAGDVALAVTRALDVTVTATVDSGGIDVRGDELETHDGGSATRVVLGDGSRRLDVTVGVGDVSITTLGRL